MEIEHKKNQEIREAALRPITRTSRRFWVITAVLAAMVALGIVAYVYQLRRGLVVTGLNDNVFWGIYLTDFVAFIGISYGGAVVSAILRLTRSSWRAPITRLAEAMALVSLVVGALFTIIHLGRPERLWELLVSPNPASPVVWDVVAISTYLVATLLFFYLPLIPDLAVCRDWLGGKAGWLRRKVYSSFSLNWSSTAEQHRLLAWGTGIMSIIIIPLAVAVHSVLSWAFAVTSRPGWHSTIFGPYFVVAALFSGVAAVILVVAAFRKAYHLESHIGEKQLRYLGYLMLTLGLMYLYFTFSEFLTEGYVLAESTVPLMESLLMSGYAPLFWFFVIAAGVVPVLLVAMPRTRTASGITVAAALVVAGMWVKRFLIIVPTLRQALLPSTTLSYAGSWVEASITLAAAAAIPLSLMLIFKVVPVMSISEMEEVATRHSEDELEPVAALQLAGGKQQ